MNRSTKSLDVPQGNLLRPSIIREEQVLSFLHALVVAGWLVVSVFI